MANEKLIAYLKSKIEQVEKLKSEAEKTFNTSFKDEMLNESLRIAASGGIVIAIGKISAYKEVLRELENEGSN